MAKLIRFPLKLADGTEARSLEELREHGDVESVLKHYREGTLARWLRVFGQQELAEKVAAHRNAQVECSKANLREVFPLLGIPLEETAFAEYCETTLSDKFVFSDAEGGDLKTYGQGVSIKDKLVEFLPEGKLPGGDLLEDWEVTETELDEGNLLVEFTCEKRNILVSLQFAHEDECYKKVTNQLERLVNASNPVVPEYDTENTQESPKAQDVQELRNYRIGERGPGGGLVFHIEGSRGYEVSEVLGTHKWAEAEKVAEGYRGGNLSDWRLPTKEELNLAYQNLRKPGIITDGNWYWSSSKGGRFNSEMWLQEFSSGRQATFSYSNTLASVRAIRAFSIDFA